MFVWLVATLVPAGCVSLTPAEEHAVAEVRAIADDTARVYGVSRISVLVGSNIEGVGGGVLVQPGALSGGVDGARRANSLPGYERRV